MGCMKQKFMSGLPRKSARTIFVCIAAALLTLILLGGCDAQAPAQDAGGVGETVIQFDPDAGDSGAAAPPEGEAPEPLIEPGTIENTQRQLKDGESLEARRAEEVENIESTLEQQEGMLSALERQGTDQPRIEKYRGLIEATKTKLAKAQQELAKLRETISSLRRGLSGEPEGGPSDPTLENMDADIDGSAPGGAPPADGAPAGGANE